MSVLYNLKPPWWSINIQVWVTTASETQHALELFNQNVRVATDQGQESISQSLTCVKDNGELFSLTLILIVSLEIKNYRFCLNCVISCFFASLSRHSKPAGSSSRKLDNNCEVHFTDPVASFNALSRILHPSFSKWLPFFSSKASTSTSLEMSTMCRHSRLKYCAFNQHWRSIPTSLLDRSVLTCFVTDTSLPAYCYSPPQVYSEATKLLELGLSCWYSVMTRFYKLSCFSQVVNNIKLLITK